MEKQEILPTLYDWAGGREALEKLTKLFYEKVALDELLAPVFENMSPAHTKHVAHFIAEVFGGPAIYTSEDGGSHSIMIRHHLGKMLNEEKRKRWMTLLLETADETGIPSDPEFRSALLAYLEWGSRIAVINSALETNPAPADSSMPVWGWGEPRGPYIPK